MVNNEKMIDELKAENEKLKRDLVASLSEINRLHKVANGKLDWRYCPHCGEVLE